MQERDSDLTPREPALSDDKGTGAGEATSAGGAEVLVTRRTTFIGPLPPPTVLAEYASIQPELVGEIIALAKQQHVHRFHMERRTLQAKFAENLAGMFCGWSIAIAFLCAAVHLALNGHASVGALLGGVDLVALVTVFVLGRRHRLEERQASQELTRTA